MKKNSVAYILILVWLIILSANLYWFVSGTADPQKESTLRIVLGSLFIFILPGFIWGEILGFRSRHLLETIALSFAITIAIEAFILPIPFLLHTTIKLWVALLFAISLTGAVILINKIKTKNSFCFIEPALNFFDKPFLLYFSTSLLTAIIVSVSIAAYRWGENLTNIAGEKLLHMFFIRYYYSLPMVLRDLGVIQGAPPSNMVHFWEYLIAGWASTINMDPLYVFYRARFVIPLLGFSSMYLLIGNLFSDRVKSEIILWSVVIMSIAGFIFLPPSNLDWVKSDPTRSVMAFMGTVHHSDAGMDILLPLGAGLLLMVTRNINKKNIFLLFGAMLAIFLWHPREFFQIGIYGGLLGIVLVTPPFINKNKIKNWAIVMCVMVMISMIIFPFSKAISSKQVHGYNEFAIKKAALTYAFCGQSIFGVRNLFNFPFHQVLASSDEPDKIQSKEKVFNVFQKNWNYVLWLILSALAVPFLAIYGDKKDKQFTLFYILLWFLLLGWNFSMLLLISLTYNEIFISTPRLIYLFSYLIIGTSFAVFFTKIGSRLPMRKFFIICPVSMLIMGLIAHLWWRLGVPLKGIVSIALSLLALCSFVIILIKARTKVHYSYKPALLIPAIISVALFFYPITANNPYAAIQKFENVKSAAIDWFGNANPFGLSDKLIRYIREIPPKQKFLVDPIGEGMVVIPIYAPHYLAVVGGANVLSDLEIYREIIRGRHPLFIEPDILRSKMLIKNLMDYDHKIDLLSWNGPDSINMNDLSKIAPPLIVTGYVGEFNFERMAPKDPLVIRVSPYKKNLKESFDIQFCYIPGKNGLDAAVIPGQEVVFSVFARCSDNARNPAKVFIQDKTDEWEKRQVPIDSASWTQYIISKQIRPGATEIRFGINWEPADEHEYVEIKDASMLIAKEPDHERFVAENINNILRSIDHEAVRDWLNKHSIDYIFIQKKYYFLLDYFRRHPENFDIVFNNPGKSEIVIRYIRK